METPDKIRDLTQKTSLPQWWIELVAIEYLECRHFCKDNDIWSIDFNLLVNEDLETITNSATLIIPSGYILFHNIEKKELQNRFIDVMLGENVSKRPDIIVNGLANRDCFAISFNTYDAWDPKLDFNEYCIVLDNGQFYQWEIARPEVMQGSTQAWWKSPFLNLGYLENVNGRINDLRNNFRNNKELDLKQLRIRSRYLYRELESVRQPIRKAILEYHKSQKVHAAHFVKVKPSSQSSPCVNKIPHYRRNLQVPISKAFDYFSNVELYPTYYPEYCQRIDSLIDLTTALQQMNCGIS